MRHYLVKDSIRPRGGKPEGDPEKVSVKRLTLVRIKRPGGAYEVVALDKSEMDALRASGAVFEE